MKRTRHCSRSAAVTYFLPKCSFMSRHTVHGTKKNSFPIPAADCGKRTPPGVAFQRVPLFLCQNVPLQTICRCVLRFKDYGAPAVKRSLKVRLCAGGKAALELSVAALFQNAERFRGFVYVGPLPVRIEGAGGFYCALEKVALCVVDFVLIPQGGALVVYHGSTPLPNTGRRVWSPCPP